MRIAYFDCFHGAAGDMMLASLLDAGLDRTALDEILATLPVGGYTLEHQQVISHHVHGSRIQVNQTDANQPSRTWADIRTMLETSDLPARTRTWALATFARLAQAEAAVHGVDIEQVHFHEVGAVDSIVDIVGVCAGLDLLGIEAVYASALPLGNGWVATQHGMLPVPAPATLKVLATVGAPVIPADSRGELLTPTAAALLAELVQFEQPVMRVQQVGYGFGHREHDRLNGLRVWIGETLSRDAPRGHDHDHDHHHDHHDHHHHHHHHHHHNSPSPHPFSHQGSGASVPPSPDGRRGQGDEGMPGGTLASSSCETVVEMRCNLDDTTGEIAAYTIEQLFAAGVLDAWAVPLVMKKGRPAMQLACLLRSGDVEHMAHLLLSETSTLGVRWELMDRLVADRRSSEVSTPWGTVRVKHKLHNGNIVASSPEYDDCASLARKHHVPLMQVYAYVTRNS